MKHRELLSELHLVSLMRIATWNVNGLRARESQVREWIETSRPDIICLQEIKANAEQIPASLCEMENYWCYWHGGPRGYSGVGLHVSKTFSPTRPRFFHPSFDFENRMVAVEIGELNVASIYVPNGGKDFPAKLRFIEALERFAQTYVEANSALVLCGDLNIARTEIDVHEKERNPRVTGQTPREREWFERLLTLGFVDLGRAMAPENEGLFTWWAPWRNMRERNIGWRLDYIIASEFLARRARACQVETTVGTSDHAPVSADFDL